MSTATPMSAAMVSARLDRLPDTKHIWKMVVLMSLGGLFEYYDIWFTAYVAPGLFKSGIITPTTESFFGMTGLASFIAALFSGMFLGTILMSQIADRFGRRKIFVVALLWYSFATLMLAFQDTANGLNFWRFVAGIGIGVEQVTIDTYLSELVPKRVRSKAFAFSSGISFLAVPMAACFAWLLVPLQPFGLDGWRWVVLIGMTGAVFIWILRLQLPESPRWLAQQGRLEEAEKIISDIENKVQAESGKPLPPVGTPATEGLHTGSYKEMFSPEYRGRTILMMIFHATSVVGIYGFANWIPTLLIAKGIVVTKSLEYGFIIAFAVPLTPLLCMLFANKVELKWQMCLSALGIALAGILLSTQEGAVAVTLLGLAMGAATGWLSYSFHGYQSELYPTRMRARAVGFVYSWSRVSVVLTSYIIAGVLKEFGQVGVFVFICLAMAVVIGAVGLFGPRTKDLALAEISA